MNGMRPRLSTVVRPWEWALPPVGVPLEVISELPADWAASDRSHRRPPLLFVHGAGAGAWVFEQYWMRAAVRRGYPAHAISLRGHGGSGGRHDPARALMRDYLHDVLQAVVALPESPVLVGHGFGALVVEEVLQRYPARAAVLVAPQRRPDDLRDALGRAVGAFWRRPLGALRTVATGDLAPHPEQQFSNLPIPVAQRYLDRFGRTGVLAGAQSWLPGPHGPVYTPVAVAGCHLDEFVDPEDVRLVAARYATRPIWLPGVGHQVMLDGGHGVALDILLDWVDQAVPLGSHSLARDGAFR